MKKKKMLAMLLSMLMMVSMVTNGVFAVGSEDKVIYGENENNAKEEVKPENEENGEIEEIKPENGENGTEEEIKPENGENGTEEEVKPENGENGTEEEVKPENGENGTEEEVKPENGENGTEEEVKPENGENGGLIENPDGELVEGELIEEQIPQVDMFALNSAEYTVSTPEDFANAVTAIEASFYTQSAITFDTNSIDVNGFNGIEDKQITLKSTDDENYSIRRMGTSLIGDITFDNVAAYNEYSVIYANGHVFETTENFSGGRNPNARIKNLYGGGSIGKDVEGDTNIILRGGGFSYVYGGGHDSNVSGDVNILIDGAEAYSGNLFGGGRAEKTDSGTVTGDVNMNVRKGLNGQLLGGGKNVYSKDNRDAAKVSGDVNITLGYEGAPADSVKTGIATYTHGGSWNSTVGNVRMSLLEGSTNESTSGDRNYFGCGYYDTVLGTVEIIIDGSDLNDDGHIYGGAEFSPFMGDSYGSVKILNENNEEYALSIKYDSPSDNTDGGINAGSDGDIETEINGNVLLEVNEGNLAFCILDNEYQNRGNCKINGDALIYINGGRIGQIEGNYFNKDSEVFKNQVIYDNCGEVEMPQESGFLNKFHEVILKNKAQVEINSRNFFQFNSDQKPFYAVNGMEIQSESTLTTVAGQAWIYGDMSLDGTWEQKYVVGTPNNYNDIYVSGNVTVDGGTLISNGTANLRGTVDANEGKLVLRKQALIQNDVKVNDTEIRLPVMQNGENYPDSAGIPLEIRGKVLGLANVFTMDKDKWELNVTPIVGENYIVALREGSEKVFMLANDEESAKDLYFKKLVDANTSKPNNDMWQVARSFVVNYNKNGGDTEASPRKYVIEIDDENATYYAQLPEENPIKKDHTFEGWNTKADGSGTNFIETTPVTESITVYAQWKKDETGEGDVEQSYDITYDPNHETTEEKVIDQDKKEGETITVKSGNIFTAPEGKEFVGWSDKPDGNLYYSAGEKISMPSNDMHLYAMWKNKETTGGGGGNVEQSYDITYDPNHETTEEKVIDQDKKEGETITVKSGNIFTAPEGKEFVGWSDKPDGNLYYSAGEKFSMPSNDMHLYAMWKDTVKEGETIERPSLNYTDHFAYVVGYPEGTVKPEKNITREEVASIYFCLLTDGTRRNYKVGTNTFEDVDQDRWSNTKISTLENANIVKGLPDGTFAPEKAITRAEFASIAASFDDKDSQGTSSFADVKGHWAENHIARAAELGWIRGYEDGTFKPDEAITRAEAMTFINRVLNRIVDQREDLHDDMIIWPDNKPKLWYYLDVQEATNSHDYKRKEGGLTEMWIQMLENKDWDNH